MTARVESMENSASRPPIADTTTTAVTMRDTRTLSSGGRSRSAYSESGWLDSSS
jgi:hypothetical protein